MKQYRKSAEVSYAIGVYPTLELLKYRPESVVSVLVHTKGEQNSGLRQIEELCKRQGVKTEFADAQISKLAKSENCYAVGIFTKYDSPIQAENHLLLVNPDDAGNLGTICRTALAFGVNNLVIIRPSVDVFDPKVIRAAMGSVFGMNISYFDSMQEYKKIFSNQMYLFYVDGDEELSQVRFVEPWTLVFGNEGRGLPQEYASLGTNVRIKQNREVDSLNLGVAVALGIYATIPKHEKS